MTDINSSPELAGGKYLTFNLHHEGYGIDVLRVREIIRRLDITAVPQMPEYVRGVINLRGRIISILDLRRRFDFPPAANTDLTCIVVVQTRMGEGKSTLMGLLVDGVEEVVNISGEDIEAPPEVGGRMESGYVRGIAKVKGTIKALLDVDKIIGDSPQPGKLATAELAA